MPSVQISADCPPSRNCGYMGCSAATYVILQLVLQVHCFEHRLDPFHLESYHAKFQLNLLKNGRDKS